MSVDLSLPLTTIDGQLVTLICTMGRDPDLPIMGYIGDSANISFWSATGDHNSANPELDLANAPVTGEVWVVVDKNGNSYPASDVERVAQYLGQLQNEARAIIRLPYSVPMGHNDLDPQP